MSKNKRPANLESLAVVHPTLGLLNGSFRPDGEMVALRGYLRHRAMLLAHRAPHILHMQKALQQMNLQLHHVLSDITRRYRHLTASERFGCFARYGMCQGVLDTDGESLVSFDRHSPESCKVLGALIPTWSGQCGGTGRPRLKRSGWAW